MFHILIADNNKRYRRKITYLLKAAGYTVSQAADGEDIFKIIETEYIDLIMLGTELTDIDVYELVSQLRAAHSETLILLATEHKNSDAVRKGYLAGTDEYIVKTIEDEELVFRIRALLRRAGKIYKQQLIIGEIVIDMDSMTVTRGEEQHTLPRKEFMLLYKLLSYPGKIFTRTQLMDEVWGVTSESSSSTLNVHINRLRTKFRAYPEFELKAVRGIGYKAELPGNPSHMKAV